MRAWRVLISLTIMLFGIVYPGLVQPASGQGVRVLDGRWAPGRAPQPAVPQRRMDSREHQAEQLYLIGRRYIEQGYYSEGLDALNHALTLRPGHPKSLTYKGIALLALREPELALQQFNDALAADPDDGVAYAERGFAYIVLGDEAKARDSLRQAVRLRPDLEPWFNQQAQWMTANRRTMNPATAQQVPGQTPAPTADTLPPATPKSAQYRFPGFRFSKPQFDLADAISLVKPAAFVVLSFLLLLLALRIALALIRSLLRRRSAPMRSAMRGPPNTSPESYPSAAQVNPTEAEPIEAIAPRPPLRRRHRWLLRVAATGLAIMAVFAIPIVVQAFRLDADKLTAPRVRPSVLDFKGNVYTHLGAPDTPITYSDLPEHLVNALRAREDSRFFEHNGVDWVGLGRAFVTDILHMRIKQGASTLTMQLVEKVYPMEQKGVLNRVRSKLVEWTMAHRAEAALTRQLGDRRKAKEAIMAAYLNRVEFGGGTVGVGAAAQYYFKKSVSKLTLGESCMLVALLRAPTANSPYRNPENARLARDKIIAQMLRRGYITDEQAKQARFVVVDNPTAPREPQNGYLVAAITREINGLKADKKLPRDIWDHEDLVIQSTLDLWAQDILDSEIRKVVSDYKGDTEEDPLGGAGLIIDNATGQIRALVSGQDYSKSQYDLALTSRRQVASIAKPFVYGAYLEQGGDITALESNRALTPDEVRALNDWNPGNSSSLKPGDYPLSTGLAFSDNLITVRVGLKAGLRPVYDTLYKAGLLSEKTTTGTTWLLGTFESSLVNVVSAYSAFPRGGTRVIPYLVQSVSIGGKEVYRAQPQTKPLFTPGTSKQLHRALREAITDGTGRTAMRNAGVYSAVAGKTGTSQNAADVWWVGYGNDITLGIRFGRDSNTSLGKAAGGTMAAPPAARALKKLSERYALGNSVAD